MIVKWFPSAKRDMQFLSVYCRDYFGLVIAARVVSSVRHKINILGEYPYMGKNEPLLSHREEQWRSLVVHENTKVIYLVGEESVNIVALWDTRRCPDHLDRYIDHVVEVDPTVLNEPQIHYGKEY